MPNLNVTNIPPPRVTFIDERTGLISREWYRWLLNIFQLTGSGSSVITLEDLQLSPSPSALTNDVVGAPLQSLSMQVGVAPPPPQLGTIASYNSDSMVAGAVAYSDGISYKMSGLGTVGQVLTSNGTAAPTWTTVGGTGTVTSVSVTSANGLAGTVTNPTTTPAISLSTTVNGIVQGNGTSLSAVTIGSGLSYSAGTLSATGGGSGTVTSVSGTGTVNGLTLTGTVTTSGNLTLGGTLDLSSPPAIGGAAPAAGAFTTLSASSTVSGTGFSTYLASPPAIGGTTAAAGTFTSLSATSRTATGVLATSAGQTANVTIANTVTYTTGGKTLATQTAASGSAWRVRAFGTFTAANSATARNAQVACFWGTTQLTAVTSTVLTATAQTTNFEAEFVLTGSSTTAIWTTGYFLNRTNSATALAMNNVTPASTTVTSGAQTLDLRFSMSVSVAGDSWSIQAVTLERLQ